MNAKDYLEEVKLINVSIKRTQRRLKRIEDMLEIHGISFDGDTICRSNDNKADIHIIEMIEQREYLRILERHYLAKDDEASFIIGAVDNPLEQYVLSLHYQDCLSFRKIGEEVYLTHEGARKACERGTRKLDVILVPLMQEYKRVATS